MPLSVEEIQRKIIAEAMRQGVPPRWAVAVAEQESGLDPQAVGGRSKAGDRSLGLFQLHRAAAIDAGIDPDRRQDLDANIRGGVTYFKQKLAQSKGNIPEALSRYNRGGPTYKGIGDPHYEKHVTAKYNTQSAAVQAMAPAPEKSLLARLSAAVTPREASAAETGGLAPGQARPGAADPRDALGERLFGPKPTRQAASPAASPAEGAAEATTGDPRDALGVRLFGPKPTAPAAETFPPLAEQEAAATQQALSGTPAGQTKDAYDVDVRRLTAAEAERLRAGAPAAPAPAAPTAQTQVELLRQQEAGRLKAEREVGSPTVPAPTPAQLGKTVAATGINLTGALGGAAIGTAIGGPIGTVFGEVAGSYGARKLNVALGFEEPGRVGDIASVAVPPMLRGVGKVVPAVTKAVVRRLPGAATALHQDVAERLTGMADRLLPAIPAEQHYAALALQNPLITPKAVAAQATDIVNTEMALAPGLRNPRLLRVARDLQKLTRQDVPMQDLYAHQQRVGELVRDFRARGGVGEGRIKQLYGAFHDDLDAAAAKGVPGAETLKDAIAASRKEHMAAEFADLFQPGKSGITIDPEGRASLNGGRLSTAWKTKLRRDKVFRDTLSAQEKEEVEDIIMTAQRLERLSTPRGGQRGSGRAAVGAAIGSALGGPAGAAFAVYAPEIIGKAMQTPTGRAMVKKALQDGGGALDTTAINALAALVRQQLAEPETQPGH